MALANAVATVRRDVRSALPWLLVILISGLVMMFGREIEWLFDPPAKYLPPISATVEAVMSWIADNFNWLMRPMSQLVEVPMSGLRAALDWLPWTTVTLIVVFVAWQGGGRTTALTALFGLIYVTVVGYWEEGINTLTLVLVCIPIAVGLGFVIGLLGFRFRSLRPFLNTLLDLMQTVPAFAYLIPILLLFGFGPAVGLIASVIFSTPPMVRNTLLGLRLVPTEVRESGTMSGCTPRQRFWWIEVPSALPQLLIGVNQTTMAALSMVVIAAIIGGFDDIGWEVLTRLRKAQFGQSIFAGMAIVCLAIILDRITRAYAMRQLPMASHVGLSLGKFAAGLLAILCFTLGLAWMFPEPLWNWPEAWVFYPAEAINSAVDRFVAANGLLIEAIKNQFVFIVLLPIKIGLFRAVAPFTWGFSLTATSIALLWTVVAVASMVALGYGRWRLAALFPVAFGLLFFGFTGLAWPVVMLVFGLFAFQLGGPRVGLFVTSSLLFLLLSGIWQPAMISVYLCTVAVIFCLLVGGLIGILASTSDTMSSIIRPINDTLQTLPQFVLLIPALMLFRVGDFTAMIAIVAYAIVPMIRYTEQGLRQVSRTAIEAGISSGCTPFQLFWQIRFKLAMPQILIGVNQTILFGLNMLVIAALVGTTGLGQQIYLALSKADSGAGIVAGLGMALIAMSADRILQAYLRRTD
ncbi:MAG: ABC transporter permease subunit [Rhodobacteraceae bacterium]|nr:ABC transporter permease subunit [Paracoccaceae bacterium]